MIRPSESTTPPATLVPPISTPIVRLTRWSSWTGGSGRLVPHPAPGGGTLGQGTNSLCRARSARSIFQSKDDPETEFRFQSSVILKNVIEEAAKRADSFLGFWF